VQIIRAERSITATCRVCSQSFSYVTSGSGSRRKFCSDECRATGKRNRITLIRCLTCGEMYAPRYGRIAGYCSIACRRFPDRKVWETRADSARHSRHKRRAEMRSRPHERFSSREIFERDGWLCGICRKPVSKLLKFPDHHSGSLDHIQPIALGGAHTRANVQCAHWICNARKTHLGVGDQLRLSL